MRSFLTTISKMTKPPNKNRSGGPKTPEGIARSSGNALRAGAYSKVVVQRGESQAEFDQILAAFIEDLQPSGMAEEAQVVELAITYWKKLRLERFENLQHEMAMEVPVTAEELARVGFVVPKDFEWVLANFHRFTLELMQDFREEIQFCERFLGGKASYEDFQMLKQDFPDLYQRLVALAQEGRVEDYSDDTLRCFTVVDRFDQRVHATEFIAQGLIKGLGEIIEAYEHRAEYLAAFKKVRMQRRIELMTNNRLGRPAEELSRAFARTMSELRKQQDWRRNRDVIDVTPVNHQKTNKMFTFDA